MPLIILMGIGTGLGLFAFDYGDGLAYLSDDPAACTQCHVMNEQYDSWLKSSHHGVATCNDCHLDPHPVLKWVTKADNGLMHSLAFTTGDFPDPIRIKPRNLAVTERACASCHSDLMSHQAAPGAHGPSNCTHCHWSVGHGAK